MPIDPRATGAVVGDQPEQGRLKRPEPQADQKGGRDRHRDPEARSPFPEARSPCNESAEAKGDQDRLQSTIPREPGDRVFRMPNWPVETARSYR